MNPDDLIASSKIVMAHLKPFCTKVDFALPPRNNDGSLRKTKLRNIHIIAAPNLRDLDNAQRLVQFVKTTWGKPLPGTEFPTSNHTVIRSACTIHIHWVEEVNFGAELMWHTGPEKWVQDRFALWPSVSQGGIEIDRKFYDKNGELVAVPTESDVFRILGIPWVEPRDRGRFIPNKAA